MNLEQRVSPRCMRMVESFFCRDHKVKGAKPDGTCHDIVPNWAVDEMNKMIAADDQPGVDFAPGGKGEVLYHDGLGSNEKYCMYEGNSTEGRMQMLQWRPSWEYKCGGRLLLAEFTPQKIHCMEIYLNLAGDPSSAIALAFDRASKTGTKESVEFPHEPERYRPVTEEQLRKNPYPRADED